MPSGSFRNLSWQAGQRSKRNPLCEGAVSSSDESDSSRWRICGDGFHVVVVEVFLRDLGRVEAGERLDLDHVAGVAGCGQIFTAEITREVDHQRLIPQ